jgi:hypothetical protein
LPIELQALIQPKDGCRVLFSDIFKSLKCTAHREYLNPNNGLFHRKKGHLAKALGYSDFYIDKEGFLKNFELISTIKSESKRLKTDIDFYRYIIAQKGLCSWVKDALESDLFYYRSEIEIVKKTQYLFGEFHEEVFRRLSSSSLLNGFFSGSMFVFFRNSLLFEKEFAFDENQLIDPFLGKILFEKKSIECSISFEKFVKNQITLVNIRNRAVERSFIVKSGSMLIDERYMRFCTYLKQIIPSIPCFNIRSFDDFGVMDYIDGCMLRDFDPNRRSLNPDTLMKSFIACALPLYLCDGADRHYENYIIGHDGLFYAIDFTFLFGNKPRSATDCFGIGTTLELKKYFVERNLWDEAITSAKNYLSQLRRVSGDVCKMAHFFFGDIFHDISVFKIVEERLANEDLFVSCLDYAMSTSIKNGQRAIISRLSNLSHLFSKSEDLSQAYSLNLH